MSSVETKYVAKIFRAFKPGKPLTAAQRHSGLFDEEPRIGHRRLRRGVTLFLTAAEMEINKVRLRLLEKAGAIVIEPIDTVEEVVEAKRAEEFGGQLPESQTLPPLKPGQMPPPEGQEEPPASPQVYGEGTMPEVKEDTDQAPPAVEITPEPEAPAAGKRGRRKKE